MHRDSNDHFISLLALESDQHVTLSVNYTCKSNLCGKMLCQWQIMNIHIPTLTKREGISSAELDIGSKASIG